MTNVIDHELSCLEFYKKNYEHGKHIRIETENLEV